MRILLVDNSAGSDAAALSEFKEAALADVRSLPATTPVTLFAMAGEMRLVHSGPAGDLAALARGLDTIELVEVYADLATALDVAAAFARQSGEPESSVLVLMRLFYDLDETFPAALRCEADLRVETLGREHPVSLVEWLRREFDQNDRPSTAANHGGSKRITPDPAGRPAAATTGPIEFTVTYPGLLPLAEAGALTVYALMESMRDELAEVLRERQAELGSRPAGSSSSAGTVSRGTELTFRPVFRELRCTPAQQSMIWDETLQDVRFQVGYAGPAADRAVCTGQVDVSADGLLIAQLPVSIEVTAGAPAAAGAPVVRADARMIRDVFASYAHEDEDMVRRCKAAYRALGIRLFVDRDDLLSGQHWRNALAARIRTADLVQLYWSAHSAASEQVAEEWRLALATGKPGFLRPCYWTRPLASVPADLTDLHFTYIDPQSVGLPVAAPAPPPPRVVDAGFPIIACVPDTDGTLAYVRRRLTTVVAFVEGLIGTRYVPPPSVLVDEATIGAVRAPAGHSLIEWALGNCVFSEAADTVIGDLAARHGVPDFARPPTGAKVLVATGALERMAAELQDEWGSTPGRAAARAAGILNCALVHEHVRAALRQVAEDAPHLQTAIAAWAPFHFVRDEYYLPGHSRHDFGDPARLESLYREEGLPGIRALITRLRADPAAAEREFDAGRIDEDISPYL